MGVLSNEELKKYHKFFSESVWKLFRDLATAPTDEEFHKILAEVPLNKKSYGSPSQCEIVKHTVVEANAARRGFRYDTQE